MPAHAARQALLARCQRRQAVTALGVTGHQAIPPEIRSSTVEAVRDIFRRVGSPLLGVTSLAAGADQLVAIELVRNGGQLHVIVPCRNYERTFTSTEGLACFRSLLEAAHDVTTLDYSEPSEEAFMAAGKTIVDRCEMLLAIWDGRPARGLGGTADVVAYARSSGKAVNIVWPDHTGP
jgi:hypothetical protein